MSEKTAPSQEVRELLTGDFEDKAAEKSIEVELTRGTVTIYAGPASARELDEVVQLFGKEGKATEAGIANLVSAIILLARNADGSQMFVTNDKTWLEKKVDTKHLVQIAEFLANTATASLEKAEVESGKD